MNKNLLLVLVTLSCSASVLAQPMLTAANFNPVVGDAFINLVCDTTGITPGASGVGITWDFHTLVITSTDTGTATACSATPNCALFPGSTYAIVSNATHFTPYYMASSSTLSQTGYYESADTNAIYSDPIDQFRYPFSLDTSFTDTYAGLLTWDTTIVHETGTITVTCDGFGTLKLPGGVIDNNVLRVHTTQLFVDSANVFGFPLVESFQLESYAWYVPNYHSPLMAILITTQVGGTYTNKAVSYAPVQIATSAPLISGIENSLQLYPNPAQNILNIRYNAATSQYLHISLYDLLGREVAVISDHVIQGAQNISYNTSALPKGLYLLRLQSDTETITRKVEIQ